MINETFSSIYQDTFLQHSSNIHAAGGMRKIQLFLCIVKVKVEVDQTLFDVWNNYFLLVEISKAGISQPGYNILLSLISMELR